MAKSVEDIIQLQLGGQALQIARLISENEMLKEKLADKEGLEKNVREPDKSIHLVNKEGKKE